MAHWIGLEYKLCEDILLSRYVCSECGKEMRDDRVRYECEKCGAKMTEPYEFMFESKYKRLKAEKGATV